MFGSNWFGAPYFGEAFIDVTAVLPPPDEPGYLLGAMRLYPALDGTMDLYPAMDGEIALKPS